MNPEVEAAWTEDLESGNIKQGKNCLGRKLPDGTEEYCCLGVLEERALSAGIVTKSLTADGHFVYVDVEPTSDGYSEYCDSSEVILTEQTAKWAGLDENSNPTNPVDKDNFGLAEMNDNDYAFSHISNQIKKGLS